MYWYYLQHILGYALSYYQDILLFFRYQFPNWSNKLVKVRGMFITAAHTVQEVTGEPTLWYFIQTSLTLGPTLFTFLLYI